jgi:16S rRNA (uracil1498-N3)-methyltransferase
MTEPAPKVRLFVGADLAAGAEVALDRDQAHYLFSVMRLGPGAAVAVFNGRDGEWRARVAEAGRAGLLVAEARTAAQRVPPDLWLLFAPVKKARTDFIVEKATELGAARIQPVFTRFTNAERLRPERLRRIAIEAAEQCGETHVPEVAEAVRLDRLLADWEPGRRIVFCDERREAGPAAAVLRAAGAVAGQAPGPWAVLIGPEGGFAPEEAERLRALPYVVAASLGPRVLRADTAAAAALAIWQSVLGDWRAEGEVATVADAGVADAGVAEVGAEA